MNWLNYHHLYYFWVAAREGGITKASQQLYLTPPTLSAQIRRLENALGERLFDRVGRRLELTEMGKVVYRYASEIFSLGREMVDTVKGRPTGRPLRLVVGVADVIPKLLVRHVLEPAQRLPAKVRLVVREDPYDRLLGSLAAEELDMVLADAPVGPGARVRAFNHLLGSSGISFLAAPRLASQLKGRLPACLHGAPMLMPSENTELRRPLERWFAAHRLVPEVVGEFEDSSLMEAFGASGAGLFPAPSVIAQAICAQGGLRVVGQAAGMRTSFYAIVIERRVQNPAVLAVIAGARRELLGRRRPPRG